MKKVLITGANSYIGTSFERWVSQYPDRYKVDTVDMKDGSWRDKDFSYYDVVFHVAGLAHVKETKKNCELYYIINRDLAYETAKKAKEEGVKQFIFLSTMSVYGMDKGIIYENTPLNPKSHYGKSKLQAEKLILQLEDDNFKIVILRPPMVYGKGCKGNYPKLAKLVLKTPIFPYVNNRRSMIYIDNLCEFVKILIDDCSNGIYFPQNNEYVNISEMVKLIAEARGKKIIMIRFFSKFFRLVNLSIFNKVFNDLVYDKSISVNYKNICDFKESIYKTEGVKE